MFDEMQKTAHTIAHNAIHLSQEGQIYGGTFKFVSGRAQEVLATLNLIKRLIFRHTKCPAKMRDLYRGVCIKVSLLTYLSKTRANLLRFIDKNYKTMQGHAIRLAGIMQMIELFELWKTPSLATLIPTALET